MKFLKGQRFDRELFLLEFDRRGGCVGVRGHCLVVDVDPGFFDSRRKHR